MPIGAKNDSLKINNRKKVVKVYANEPTANNAENLGKLYAQNGYNDAVISLDNVFIKSIN